MRKASMKDLQALWELEKKCFEAYRQDSRESIKRSLSSNHQEVWVVDLDRIPVAAIIVRITKRALRIYSISVSPDNRGSGMGLRLMRLVFKRARQLDKEKVLLEVDEEATQLIAWYEKLGFTNKKRLPDYYAAGKSAIKMEVSCQQ